MRRRLTRQFSEKFLLVHAVLEGFAAIDEDHGDFVVELAAQFVVGVHVNLTPDKASAARELGETFFYNLAEMASFAGIDHDAASLWHAGRF